MPTARVCSAREREREVRERERERPRLKSSNSGRRRERGGGASLPPPPPGVHSSYVGLGQQQLGKTNEEGNDECRGSKSRQKKFETVIHWRVNEWPPKKITGL